jgi:hypothetical protein
MFPCRRFVWMPTAFSVAAFAGYSILAAPAAYAQGGAVGKLSITRQVEVSSGPITAGTSPSYKPARQNQNVSAGQGIRTLKRSQAEITFKDTSVLRIGERTDLIVQENSTLRNVRLQRGVVWVRVAKGVNTQVETPTATAVARGTVFTVAVLGDGSVRLTVYEGIVDLKTADKTISVNPGETITQAPGTAIGSVAPSKVPLAQMPIEYGGGATGWWQDIAANGGVVSTPGSAAMLDLRSSPLTEAIQQLASTSRGANPFYLGNSLDRARLLSIAQGSLVPAVATSGLTPSAYASQFGSATLTNQLSLNASDLAFLQGLGVQDIGQFFNYVNANGAGINATARARQAYRPGSVQDRPNFDYRLLDRTDSSDTILGIGLLASVAANAIDGKNFKLFPPQGELSAFGFANDPTSLSGGRAELTGMFGKTRFRVESNLLRPLNGDGTDTQSKLASVAVFEHPIGDSATVFLGRRRFYHGPVFQNQVLSQLVADRYSSAGATLRHGPWMFEGAYLYDANPEVRGVQNGTLGSLFYRAGGGTFGVHFLKVPKVNDGNGRTFSASFPAIPNQLDLYSEVGRGVDGAALQTYGLYLPGLFQKTDMDFFVEYGSHEGVGHALSLVASRDATKNLNFRAYTTFQDGGRDITGGLGLIARFGNK